MTLEAQISNNKIMSKKDQQIIGCKASFGVNDSGTEKVYKTVKRGNV